MIDCPLISYTNLSMFSQEVFISKSNKDSAFKFMNLQKQEFNFNSNP